MLYHAMLADEIAHSFAGEDTLEDTSRHSCRG